MIPILFSGDAATFNSNGKGLLSDCISCEPEQTRNGIFELNMVYPIDGIHYQDIEWGDIILAKAEDGKDPQAFFVQDIRPTMDGKAEIFCEHISYILNWVASAPFTAETVNEALLNMKPSLYSGGEDTNRRYERFDYWTDKSTSAHFEHDTLVPARSVLAGTRGSILDVYGGEYEFDNFHVKLWQNRGSDKGVVIRYGKNLTDMKADWSAADSYNRVMAFWKGKDTDGNDVVVNGTSRWGWSTPNYYYSRTRVVDASQDFSEKPTLAEINEYAHSYSTAHGNDRFTKDNITINFVALQDTEEYKNVANLEHVNLCDTVSVLKEEMGIEYQAKVIRTKYDTLRERYIEIEIGSDVRSTFGQTLKKDIASNSEAAIATVETNVSQLRAALEEATGKITGATDGYIKQIFNSTGDWSELVAMNTNDPATATKVWRMNYEGIGGGTSYDGPFTITMTLDGKINASQITTGVLNADLITAGTMSANRILGGTLKLGGANNTNGLLEIYDASGTKIGYWDNSGLHLISGNTNVLLTQKSYTSYLGGSAQTVNVNGLATTYGNYYAIEGMSGGVVHKGYNIGRAEEFVYGNYYTLIDVDVFDPEITRKIVDTTTGAVIIQDKFGNKTMSEDGSFVPGYEIDVKASNTSVKSLFFVNTKRIGYNGDNASMDIGHNGEINIRGGSNSVLRGWGSTGLYYNNNKVAYTSSSSRRYKHLIRPIESADLDPHKLLSLPVVQFEWNEDHPLQYDDMKGKTIPGIIAEDVEEIYPAAAIHDTEGRVESWDERRLIPGMLALIQEQDAKIKQLEARLAKIEEMLT